VIVAFFISPPHFAKIKGRLTSERFSGLFLAAIYPANSLFSGLAVINGLFLRALLWYRLAPVVRNQTLPSFKFEQIFRHPSSKTKEPMAL
jgi:hypothetical protein